MPKRKAVSQRIGSDPEESKENLAVKRTRIRNKVVVSEVQQDADLTVSHKAMTASKRHDILPESPPKKGSAEEMEVRAQVLASREPRESSENSGQRKRFRLERKAQVKPSKSNLHDGTAKKNDTNKKKAKKSGHSAVSMKAMQDTEEDIIPKSPPKELKPKKPPKPEDMFSKKVAEFKRLAAQSPDVIKLISENELTIGAHISVAKGIFNGLINAFKIKATAMAFFVTQPRKWSTDKGKI